MGRKEIEEFLIHLAVEEDVAAPTQNQALNKNFQLCRHHKATTKNPNN